MTKTVSLFIISLVLVFSIGICVNAESSNNYSKEIRNYVDLYQSYSLGWFEENSMSLFTYSKDNPPAFIVFFHSLDLLETNQSTGDVEFAVFIYKDDHNSIAYNEKINCRGIHNNHTYSILSDRSGINYLKKSSGDSGGGYYYLHDIYYRFDGRELIEIANNGVSRTDYEVVNGELVGEEGTGEIAYYYQIAGKEVSKSEYEEFLSMFNDNELELMSSNLGEVYINKDYSHIEKVFSTLPTALYLEKLIKENCLEDEKLNVKLINIDGRYLAPLRAVVEEMGAAVDWNNKTREIAIRRNGIDYFEDIIIKITIDNKRAFVNGEEISLDVAPMLVNNITYIPIRFLGESLGYRVYWDGLLKRIKLSNSNNQYYKITID